MKFQLTFKANNPEKYLSELYPVADEAIIGLGREGYIDFDFHTQEYGSGVVSEKIAGIKSIIPNAQLVNLII